MKYLLLVGLTLLHCPGGPGGPGGEIGGVIGGPTCEPPVGPMIYPSPVQDPWAIVMSSNMM